MATYLEAETERIAASPTPSKKVKMWQAHEWFCGICVLCSSDFMVLNGGASFQQTYNTGWCPICCYKINMVNNPSAEVKSKYYATCWQPKTCWKFRCRVCGTYRAYSDEDHKVMDKFNWECARCEKEVDVTLSNSQGSE